jgi:hypothetical protein
LSGVARFTPIGASTSSSQSSSSSSSASHLLPYSPLFLPHLPALWLQFPVALDEAVPLTCFALLQLASCAGAAAGMSVRRLLWLCLLVFWAEIFHHHLTFHSQSSKESIQFLLNT